MAAAAAADPETVYDSVIPKGFCQVVSEEGIGNETVWHSEPQKGLAVPRALAYLDDNMVEGVTVSGIWPPYRWDAAACGIGLSRCRGEADPLADHRRSANNNSGARGGGECGCPRALGRGPAVHPRMDLRLRGALQVGSNGPVLRAGGRTASAGRPRPHRGRGGHGACLVPLQDAQALILCRRSNAASPEKGAAPRAAFSPAVYDMSWRLHCFLVRVAAAEEETL